MFGIARNVVLEHGRREHRTVPLFATDRPSDDRGPEQVALAVDERATVRHAFARLDDDERELLELRVHGGLSAEDVGLILGKQPGAVRMAQSRALQRLRTFVEEVQRG